jgi:hypothetical protein
LAASSVGGAVLVVALQDLDRTVPGFGHDIRGVELADDGTYRVMCMRDDALAGDR